VYTRVYWINFCVSNNSGCVCVKERIVLPPPLFRISIVESRSREREPTTHSLTPTKNRRNEYTDRLLCRFDYCDIRSDCVCVCVVCGMFLYCRLIFCVLIGSSTGCISIIHRIQGGGEKHKRHHGVINSLINNTRLSQVTN
jgi:hypothetical protein